MRIEAGSLDYAVTLCYLSTAGSVTKTALPIASAGRLKQRPASYTISSMRASMNTIVKLDKFTASPFRQEIELQHVDHEADFSTLRVRIREKSRFTVFDIDALTAAHWGEIMMKWAQTQKQTQNKEEVK